MRRWSYWILLVVLATSLGANAYLLSAHWDGGKEMPRRDAIESVQRRLDRLPEGEASAARQVLAGYEPLIRQRIEAQHEARRAARRLSRQEGVDRARLETAFADLRARTDEVQATLHSYYAEIAPDLSPQSRRILLGTAREARQRD